MSKRFKAVNAEALVSHLKSSGLDPDASVGAPTLSWHGGCGYGCGCCATHPGFIDGVPMLSVYTRVSGRQLHRIAVSLGLV
jgi:hypothetical protein